MSRVAHPAGPRHASVAPAGHPPAPPADLNALDPAVWPRGARRSDGVLTLAGLDVRDLAGEYGTPLFVLDEADFRGRCRDFRQAFGADTAVFYAAAAFCSRGVLRWAAEEGLGVGVCTGGELEVALQAGVDPVMIILHGSNKLTSELERALGAGVGHVVADSYEEIARLAYLTEEVGAPGPLVRPIPAVASTDPGPGGQRRGGARPTSSWPPPTTTRSSASRCSPARPTRRRGACSPHRPGPRRPALPHRLADSTTPAGFEVAARRMLELAARIAAEYGGR